MADTSGSEDGRRPTLGVRSKPPGLREIAAYLHLSPSTVSMVINDVPLAKSLSAETRARVHEAARLFNYRPNLIARALSKRQSQSIGVIAPESSDGYFPRVMRGIEAAMLKSGYLCFITSHLGREDLIRECPAALLQRGVDGLIFLNTPISQHPGVPTVCISDDCEMPEVTSILVDQRAGMDEALQHLYHLGHRRILMMRGENASLDADDRYDSMIAAAWRLGLPTPPELRLSLQTNQLTPRMAFDAVRPLLVSRPPFTAIVAFNDIAALGAMRAIVDAGLRCPEDISVVGVDDISTSAYLSPRLTTAAQPLEAMGAAAAEQLVARIQHPEREHPRQVMFPMTLEVRESTCTAPLAHAPSLPRHPPVAVRGPASITAPLLASANAADPRGFPADGVAEHR